MNITLKNIKYVAALSEETPCYTAAVYIDGKKAGTVSNRGHGGPDEVNIDDKDLDRQLQEFIKQQPPVPFEWGDKTPLPMTEDMFFGQLFEKEMQKKDMAKFDKKAAKDSLKYAGYGVLQWKHDVQVWTTFKKEADIATEEMRVRLTEEFRAEHKLVGPITTKMFFKGTMVWEKTA
jgi:hypothetical protein